MWSVHTRNETTSRRYPPEVHADLPPRTSEARGARWGPLHAGRGGGADGGKSSGKGAAGGPRRSRRLALYGSRIGVGDVGALRLLQCALYSPTLTESHALTSSSSTRRTPERGERPRVFHEATSERTFASEQTSGERATGPRREAGPSGKMRPVGRFQRDIYYIRALPRQRMLRRTVSDRRTNKLNDYYNY